MNLTESEIAVIRDGKVADWSQFETVKWEEFRQKLMRLGLLDQVMIRVNEYAEAH